MWPDLAPLPQAVAATPGRDDQAGNLGQIARQSIMRIAGPGKQSQQGVPLLLRREGNVSQSGRGAENGQLLPDHVPVDRERGDAVGRLVNHHLETLECRHIAGPCGAPRQLQQRRSRNRGDPLLVLKALRQAAHLQSEMEAVVGGTASDIAVVEQGLQQPVHGGSRHAGLARQGESRRTTVVVERR